MTQSPSPEAGDTISEHQSANDEALEAHIAPLREPLSDLLDLSDQIQNEAGYLPSADSRFMAELATEKELALPGRRPVQTAHDLAQLPLFAMADCARATIRLLRTDRTPVFAHVVLARAALEHARGAWWLFDPGIDVRRRVARSMNDRIYSFGERARLPLSDADLDRNRDDLASVYTEADAIGFQRVAGTPYIEESRPGQTEIWTALKKLLEAGPG